MTAKSGSYWPILAITTRMRRDFSIPGKTGCSLAECAKIVEYCPSAVPPGNQSQPREPEGTKWSTTRRDPRRDLEHRSSRGNQAFFWSKETLEPKLLWNFFSNKLGLRQIRVKNIILKLSLRQQIYLFIFLGTKDRRKTDDMIKIIIFFDHFS